MRLGCVEYYSRGFCTALRYSLTSGLARRRRTAYRPNQSMATTMNPIPGPT